MTDIDKKKIISRYNSRLKSIIKSLRPGKEDKAVIMDTIKNVVPDTDVLTKQGYISTSKKALAKLNDLSIGSIEANTQDTVTELKQRAKDRLEESGISDEIKITAAVLKAEVLAELTTKEKLDNVIAEWYDFRMNVDPAAISEIPGMRELDQDLYTKGVKSYAELKDWMNKVNSIMH